jgi:predicted membrane channel-forming protein YqfA (hemolysin III family)
MIMITILSIYLVGILPAILGIRLYNHFQSAQYLRLSGVFIWFSWLAILIVIINSIIAICTYVSRSGRLNKISQFFDNITGYKR